MNKQLRRGAYKSVPKLKAAIQAFIDAHQEHPKAFVWTKTADQILASIARFAQRTFDLQPHPNHMDRITEAKRQPKHNDASSSAADVLVDPRAVPSLHAHTQEPRPVPGDAVRLSRRERRRAPEAGERPDPSVPDGPAAEPVRPGSTEVSVVHRGHVVTALEPAVPPPVDTTYDRVVPLERSTPEAHLLDYLRVVERRRWPAALIVLLVFACTAGYAFTATPMYEASTTLLLESDKRNAVTFGSVTDQSPTTDEYYQTRYKLLASQSLAAKTLDALNLWSHPEFDPSQRAVHNETPSATSRMIQAVASMLQPLSRPSEDALAGADDATRRSTVIDGFLRHLTVSPVRNTHLVEVKFRSTDRALAVNAANAHAQAFILQNLESTVSDSRDVSGWLEKQLADQRKRVEESEIAVQRYREQNDALGLDERQNVVNQKLSELNAAVTRAKTERIQKEAAYDQIRTLQDDPAAVDTFPAILSNTFIQRQKGELADLQRQQAQLGDKLGPNHPDMVKLSSAIRVVEGKIQGEIAKVVQAMHNDYQQSQAQEQSLTSALEQQKTEALALNRKGIGYGVLARDAASNRQIFESLMQRTKESGVVGDLKPSNIRIVDQATIPRSPVSPNKPSLLLLALIGGPLLGLGFVFFLEYLDSRIRTPDEVRRYLGLPTLGLVPRIARSSKGPQLLMSEGTPNNFAEAFRGVRTALLLSHGGPRARTVLVTSTIAGEGKTLSASNLAIGFAQAGEEVLLVDCDIRRPSVHRLFDVDQEPGLSDLLMGQARASEIIRPSGVVDLWLLPAGSLAPNPAELLGSRQFKEFLSSVDELYDRVVLDSPPALAVTDATILGHVAGGIVFVVNARATDRRAAATAVARLESAGGQFIGAVLNQANVDRGTYEYYTGYN